MRDNRLTGEIGEWIAYFYFLLRGYRVKRDQKLSGVQIDLVAKRGSEVVLVEVKSRKSKSNDHKVISTNQLNRIKTASKVAVMQNTACDIRIDLFVVYFSPLRVEHIRNVCDIS
ncbi:MAG: YraN family protein [Pseudomonadota bacterium]|nr:YraN family protein [Pseudomonadota bacterium]